MKTTLLLQLYSGFMRLAAPFFTHYLKRRARGGKEDPARLDERYGKASLSRPDGPLIWMHGASVGETTMALPIIERLLAQHPRLNILITSGTKTSYIKRFLDHWQPEQCLWLESELWPNIIRANTARNIPMSLLNARLSEKSRKGWQARPRTAKAILDSFKNIFPADQITAKTLSNILGRNIPVFGNLKTSAPSLPVNADIAADLTAQLAGRPVWCAASTHEGEEPIILTAHQQVLRRSPDACLLLVLRHPERADTIAQLLGDQGIDYARWGQPIKADTSVYLIDIIGQMGTIYSVSNLVLMGGSLLTHLKGHNPIEPAQMGCAILSGPYVSSFKDVYDAMNKAGAVHIIPATTAKSLIC